MTTPYAALSDRRSFLKTLGLLAAAPLVAARALAVSRSAPPLVVTTHRITPEMADLINQLLLSPEENMASQLRGAAIKVPSNRYLVEDVDSIIQEGYHPGRNVYHRYFGHWDGTFKEEVGCTNPAFILAHLTENTRGVRPDWATGIKRQGREGLIPVYDLDWRGLYDFGIWCDQMVSPHLSWTDRWIGGTNPDIIPSYCIPQYKVNIAVRTAAEQQGLHEHLRMCFIAWKAGDERYRTSCPGIPYSEEMT